VFVCCSPASQILANYHNYFSKEIKLDFVSKEHSFPLNLMGFKPYLRLVNRDHLFLVTDYMFRDDVCFQTFSESGFHVHQHFKNFGFF